METKYYEISYFLKSIDNKDFIDILDECQKKARIAENIKTKSRDDEYVLRKYIDFLKNLGFLLSQGIKPAFMSDDELQQTKPLIERLVSKGQLQAQFLDIYK